MSEDIKEGWTWLINATKWHYFRDNRSLCGKYGLIGGHKLHEFDPKDEPSSDNCSACWQKRMKEIGGEK